MGFLHKKARHPDTILKQNESGPEYRTSISHYTDKWFVIEVVQGFSPA
jgi:hypothetical protein